MHLLHRHRLEMLRLNYLHLLQGQCLRLHHLVAQFFLHLKFNMKVRNLRWNLKRRNTIHHHHLHSILILIVYLLAVGLHLRHHLLQHRITLEPFLLHP
jgi:hypothetical protein